ncbi:MAG: CAP domain-containing protein [Armatimonadota bacterium]
MAELMWDEKMMAKLFSYFISLVLSSGLATSTTGFGKYVSVWHHYDVKCTQYEQRFVALTNADRIRHGLNKLIVNSLLVEVARQHSHEMWEKNYFDHISPTPGFRTPMDRYLKRLGYKPKWALLGENLFYCSIVDVDRGHGCLMQSPEHRRNILNPDYQEIGVGCFVAPDGKFYVTQLFLAQVD